MRFTSTLIVGAGGIGSHLAEPLARLMRFHENGGKALRIVDGDVYEEKNAERQMFSLDHVGKPKADVLGTRVWQSVTTRDGAHEFPVNTECGYVASAEDAAGLMVRSIKDGGDEGALLVCLCVDNDATRRLFYDAFEFMPKAHRDVVILDCGNDLETATVVASFWSERKSKLVSPVEMYENLRTPNDRVPGGGCLALAPSTPQLMVANMAAAFSALLLVQALLDGRTLTDVVQSNIRTFTVGVAGGTYG